MHELTLPGDTDQTADRADELVLVTGGGGFIGAGLVARLLRDGARVAVLDTGHMWRLEDMGGHHRLRLHEGDIRDRELVDTLVSEASRVFHLAARVGVDKYIGNPADVLDVNVTGTRLVVDACARDATPLLIASTSEVYGKNDRVLHEDADTILGSLSNTRWCYAVSKAAGEAYARAMASRGLVYTVVRYFNVYGPYMDEPGAGRVISKFLGNLQAGEPLTLVDGGESVRAFCYIDDAVEATLRLGMDLGAEAPQAGKIVNIGRPEPVTMRELAERMIRLTGHQAGTQSVSGTLFFGEGFEEIPYRVPDVGLLRELVGVEAHTSLDTGLAKVLDHWGLLSDRADKGSDVTPEDAPSWVPFIRPHLDPDPGLMEGLAAALRSGTVTNEGPRLCAFERALAQYLDVPDVVAVGSGSSALLLGVSALGLSKGVAVLPAFTYIATLSAVVHAGFEPVFCDIDPETWTLDPVHLETILDSQDDVRLVVVVNAYGIPADHARVAAAANACGATVVTDNAHGFGTEVRGQRVADQPALQAWSLHATKVLAAVEGGLVTARDPAVLDEVRRLRRHGIADDVLASGPGFNARMDELRAAVGHHGLQGIQARLMRRRAYWNQLRSALLEAPHGAFSVQSVPDGVHPNGQNLATVWRGRASRGEVVEAFAARGIEARPYFWPPLNRLHAMNRCGPLPVTDLIGDGILCLPLHDKMDADMLTRIGAAIHEVADELGS